MKTNFNYYSSLNFIFGILVLSIIIFSSNNIDNGIHLFDKKFLIIIATIIFIIAQLYLSTNAQSYITSIFFSIYLSLYAIENIIQYSLLRRNIFNVILSGKTYDTRTLSEVARDYWNKNIKYYPRLPGNWIIHNSLKSTDKTFLPLGQISKSKVFDCNEQGYFPNNETDEYGFHNPIGIHQYGIIDTELVIIGDSLAYGTCVDDNNDIASVLRKKYPKTINLGQGGNGPLLELATLVEYGIKLKPNFIIWIFYAGNDIENLQDEITHPVLKEYYNNVNYSQNLINRQAEIDQTIKNTIENFVFNNIANTKNEFIYNIFKRAKLYWVRYFLTRLLFSNEIDAVSNERLLILKNILKKAKSLTESNNSRFLFVYIPDEKHILYRKEKDPYHDFVTNITKELDIDVLDLTPPLLSNPDNSDFYPYKKANHFNNKGYLFVSKQIKMHLEKNAN